MSCQLWIRKCSEELQSNLKTFSQMRGTHSLLKLEMMCGFTRVVVWLEPRKCPQCRIWNSWKWDIGGNQILCLAADLVPSNAHLQLPNSSEKSNVYLQFCTTCTTHHLISSAEHEILEETKSCLVFANKIWFHPILKFNRPSFGSEFRCYLS